MFLKRNVFWWASLSVVSSTLLSGRLSARSSMSQSTGVGRSTPRPSRNVSTSFMPLGIGRFFGRFEVKKLHLIGSDWKIWRYLKFDYEYIMWYYVYLGAIFWDIIPATSCNDFSKTQLLVELHPELFSPLVGPVEEGRLRHFHRFPLIQILAACMTACFYCPQYVRNYSYNIYLFFKNICLYSCMSIYIYAYVQINL